MKKLYILIFFALGFCRVEAQPYSNEWIKFSSQNPYSLQQYFKISVVKEGIYRITYSDLLGVNVPLLSINPKKMQLFRNGREQYISFSNDTATVWNSSLYFEFYGNKNDGETDAQLYDTDTSQVNKNLSLFNDTAAYFLTWPFLNIGPDGKRMIKETDVNFSIYPQSNYVIREVYKNFFEDDGSDYYHVGHQFEHGLTDNSYISGETWSSARFTNDPTNGTRRGGSSTRTSPTAERVVVTRSGCGRRRTSRAGSSPGTPTGTASCAAASTTRSPSG